ncbi:addiction module protein [Scleromatobacter humisilvae]|uniref:Addiction module protein n=1 Tax=Scleromatobacter humisilvae TaxID=2897159 RepID=A0A9X1YKS4_9BURK|nr:addiction module protein [Scleromatobacter humisilvae]MCK9688124.1 addiction module protein [Scleromatobacter humisilvae]
MSLPLTDLEAEAMKLSRDDRVRLADRLLASVYGDRDMDEAWFAEIERRIAALDVGAPSAVAEPALSEAEPGHR